MTPKFDEIVGSELTGAERERLRQVHELLVAAGPPPELSPELERTPIPDVEWEARRRRRKNWGRRAMVLLAAALLVFIIFVGGFSVGRKGGLAVAESLKMQGTPAAPHAQGQLIVYKRTAAGNWPMTLSVSGLPPLPAGSVYDVYLMRNGKLWGSCGPFTVHTSSQTATVTLNSPYALRGGDSWVVTREAAGEHGPGPTVLRPGSL